MRKRSKRIIFEYQSNTCNAHAYTHKYSVNSTTIKFSVCVFFVLGQQAHSHTHRNKIYAQWIFLVLFWLKSNISLLLFRTAALNTPYDSLLFFIYILLSVSPEV